MAIGGYALDLYACAQLGYFDAAWPTTCQRWARRIPKVFRQTHAQCLSSSWGRRAWRAVRERVSELLRHDNPAALRDNELAVQTCLLRLRDVTMLRPVKPTNYVDFYS